MNIAGGDGESLWALTLAGGGSAEQVVKTEGGLAEPRLSPDGRWLAYVSRPYEDPGGLRRALPATGRKAARFGGRRRTAEVAGRRPGVFYRVPGGPLVAVEVRERADGLELGAPTELFEAGVVRHAGSNGYAVSADGQRFLVPLPVEEEIAGRVHIVTHWMSLLD